MIGNLYSAGLITILIQNIITMIILIMTMIAMMIRHILHFESAADVKL